MGPEILKFLSPNSRESKRGALFGPVSDFLNGYLAKKIASPEGSHDSKREYDALEREPKRGIEDLISGIAPVNLGGNEDVKPRIRVYRRQDPF